MTSPKKILLVLLCTAPSVLAWLSSTTTSCTSARRRTTFLPIALDLPLDTFGDVNDDNLYDGDYYHHDAAQTIFPYLDQWRYQDGSLVGVVFNHPTYSDGQAIVTSELEADSVLAEEGIVNTVSGTQYLLGQELIVELDDWRLTTDGSVQGVVTRAHPHLKLTQGQRITTDPFALHSDIMEHGFLVTETGTQYFLLEAHVFPILEQWKRLEGGSLAGFVYRHSKIADGELITTTPLVELDESQDGIVLVTTASGSQYELGQAEPEKQFEEDFEEAEAQEVYFGQEEEEYYGEDQEEQDIPTRHIPKSNPLEHIFAAAFPHHKKIIEKHNGGDNVTSTKWES